MTGAPEESPVSTAMILGAGLGTRLASIGLEVPKVLVDIGGRPLLESQIEYLDREGVRRIVINAHHRAQAIESFVREFDRPVDVTVVTEPTLLGTAGAVRNVLDLLGEDPFFVLYGDVVIDQSLSSVARAHRQRDADATVTVYASDDVEGKGTVLVDEDSWIKRFAEKDAVPGSSALINAGLYVLDPRFLGGLPVGVPLDFGHDVFPAALARGARMLAYELAKPVIDVGTPEGLALAQARAAQSKCVASSSEVAHSKPSCG